MYKEFQKTFIHRKHTSRQQAHEKVLNIISQQRNANQKNPNEMPHHTYYIQKKKTANNNVGKLESQTLLAEIQNNVAEISLAVPKKAKRITIRHSNSFCRYTTKRTESRH